MNKIKILIAFLIVAFVGFTTCVFAQSLATENEYIQDIKKTIKAKNFENASIKCDEALLTYPNNIDILYYKSTMLTALGQEEKATPYLDKIITLTTDPYSKHIAYANKYFVAKQYTLAINEVDQAIKLQPKSTEPYLLKAQIAFHAGNDDLALKSINNVLAIDSNSASAYIMRAQIYTKLGLTEKAQQDLKTAASYSNADQ